MAALHAAKARGTKLGIPEPKKGAAIWGQMMREDANRFAVNVLPIIRDLQAQGITSNKAIARVLNTLGIQTANGRQWYSTIVKNLLRRIGNKSICN